MNKNRGLGKGLGALIPDFDENSETPQQSVLIDSIVPNPYQPRKEFSNEKLTELAESIKVHGVIQPLLVRDLNGRYQLIAGERRLRAAKLAGLTEVPIVIKEMTDEAMMEVALVENIQREDLNPIEEAEAYRRLMEEFNLTQDDIAKRVGKSRPAVANTLRLLNLPREIREDLGNGALTMGHARALLSLKSPEEQVKIWYQVKTQELSVREVEDLIRNINEPPAPIVSRETKKSSTSQGLIKDPNISEIEDEFEHSLGTKVLIKPAGVGGKIEISYYSEEDFERLCDKILH